MHVGGRVSFMDSLVCMLTTYIFYLMDPSDPLDNIESALLSAFRLLRTFTLSNHSFKVITSGTTACINVQTLKLDCETLRVSAFAGLHAAGDAVA